MDWNIPRERVGMQRVALFVLLSALISETMTHSTVAPTVTAVRLQSSNPFLLSGPFARAGDELQIVVEASAPITNLGLQRFVIGANDRATDTRIVCKSTECRVQYTVQSGDAGMLAFDITSLRDPSESDFPVSVTQASLPPLKIDTEAPSLIITTSNSNANSKIARSGDIFVVSVVSSEDLAVLEPTFAVIGEINTQSRFIPEFTRNSGGHITAANFTLVSRATDDGELELTLTARDLVGFETSVSLSSQQTVSFDNVPPEATSIELTSSNPLSKTLVRVGDIVRFVITLSEPIFDADVLQFSIGSQTVSSFIGPSLSNLELSLSYTVAHDDAGEIKISVQVFDMAGNSVIVSSLDELVLHQLTADSRLPLLSSFSLESSNKYQIDKAKPGDIATFKINSDKPLHRANITLTTNLGTTVVTTTTAINATDPTRSFEFNFAVPAGVNGQLLFEVLLVDLADNTNSFDQEYQISRVNFILDSVPPVLTLLSLTTNNPLNSSIARVGDLISAQFQSSEPIAEPVIVFFVHKELHAVVTLGSNNRVSATYALQASDIGLSEAKKLTVSAKVFDFAGLESAELVTDQILALSQGPLVQFLSVITTNPFHENIARAGHNDGLTITIISNEALETFDVTNFAIGTEVRTNLLAVTTISPFKRELKYTVQGRLPFETIDNGLVRFTWTVQSVTGITKSFDSADFGVDMFVASSDSSLSQLNISTIFDFNSFTPLTYKYSFDVEDFITHASFFAELNVSNASLSSLHGPLLSRQEVGPIELSYLDNRFSFTVVAEDLSSNSTYDIEINRHNRSDSSLRDVFVTFQGADRKLFPQFRSDIFEYFLTVPFDVAKLTITATSGNPFSLLVLDSATALRSRFPSPSQSLVYGRNTFAIDVTGSDLSVTTYLVHIDRDGQSSALFDGDSHLVFADAEWPSYFSSEGMTVEVWVALEEIATDIRGIFGTCNESLPTGWCLGVKNGRAWFTFGNVEIVGTSALSGHLFMHLAGRINTTSISVFVNGSEVGSLKLTTEPVMSISSADHYLMGFVTDSIKATHGKVQDVTLFSHPLDLNSILSHFLQTPKPTATDEGVVALYSFQNTSQIHTVADETEEKWFLNHFAGVVVGSLSYTDGIVNCPVLFDVDFKDQAFREVELRGNISFSRPALEDEIEGYRLYFAKGSRPKDRIFLSQTLSVNQLDSGESFTINENLENVEKKFQATFTHLQLVSFTSLGECDFSAVVVIRDVDRNSAIRLLGATINLFGQSSIELEPL